MKTLDIDEAKALSKFDSIIMQEYLDAKKNRKRYISVSDTHYYFAISTAETYLPSSESEDEHEILVRLISEYKNDEFIKTQKINEDVENAYRKVDELKPNHINNVRAEHIIKCPRCNSTNIHVDKKGFSVGKAALGAVVFGGIGVLAGGIGSNDIKCTCLSCGNQFKPF